MDADHLHHEGPNERKGKKAKKKKEKERERHRSRAAEIQIGPWIDGAAVPDPRIAGRKMHGGAEKG